MEIRQNVVRVPALPIVLVLATLAVLAVVVTALYTFRSNAPAPKLDADRPVVTACSGLAPDAQERCEQIMAAQLSKAEATHGH